MVKKMSLKIPCLRYFLVFEDLVGLENYHKM
jgi:hypothetical protein